MTNSIPFNAVLISRMRGIPFMSAIFAEQNGCLSFSICSAISEISVVLVVRADISYCRRFAASSFIAPRFAEPIMAAKGFSCL